MLESSDDLSVLQHHLGPQWPGAEAEGQAAMVRVLQSECGYDQGQVETVIEALTHAGKLRYHHLPYTQVEDMAARTVGQVQFDTLATWLDERRRRRRAVAHAGYWEIGNRHEGPLVRTGQIDPMG
jgi:hypothetical protein